MADYSITAVTRRVVYTGSAGVGPYAFTFPVISQTDIAVYKNSTKLTLTTNYTVTVSAANGTGSVTLVVAATGSDRITIIGARAIERTTDFVTAGDLKASSLNEQLDASIILIQQLAEENKRTLKAPQFDPAAVEDGGTLSMVLPTSTSRAGKTLAFDTDGNPVVGEDIGNWRGNWAAGVSYTVRDLVKDSSNSNVYRVNTAHTSSGTTPISSNADVAKFDLVIDAEAADASADAAAASASAAATSASNASTSASNASTSASNASTSASNASSAQTAAESARDATLAAYDSFDDRYLGSKTSDPTLDNDGNALVGGALYFNSVAGEMRIWTGSAWVAAYVSGTGFVAKAGDTMTGVLGLTAGTVSLPALTTTGDTNTGIFFPAADTIAFAEGGVEAMRINSSGQVEFTAGTAALPAISTTGDINTGVFYPAADTVGIATGGTEKVRVASSGQIGIGGANYGTSGQVLTSGGASAAPSWAAVSASGQLLRAPQVLTSGTSYTTPAGCNSILVEALGGGGGGGRGATCTGGGGAGYVKKYFTVSPSTAYTYAIGAGGASRSTNGVGNAGGSTTFTVGVDTITAGGGAGGPNTADTAAGGTATNGDINVPGQKSGYGSTLATSSYGGNSIYGSGGSLTTVTASGFGAGGAGNITANPSGAGSAGIIYISEFS